MTDMTPPDGAVHVVQVRRSDDDQFYFVAVGRNGEDGPVSETYPDASTAQEMASRWFPDAKVELIQ